MLTAGMAWTVVIMLVAVEYNMETNLLFWLIWVFPMLFDFIRSDR